MPRPDPPPTGLRQETHTPRTTTTTTPTATERAGVVSNQSTLEGDEVEESFVSNYSSSSNIVSVMVANIEASLNNKNNTTSLLDISTNAEAADSSFLQDRSITITKPDEMNEPTDAIDSSEGDVEDPKDSDHGGMETATLPSPMSNMSGPGDGSGASSSTWNHSRHKQCLFYAVMVLLLAAAIAVPVAMVTTKNNRSNSSKGGNGVVDDSDQQDVITTVQTAAPTTAPTTSAPTPSPSDVPSAAPTTLTHAPTMTFAPTLNPSSSPTPAPTGTPTTAAPSDSPTAVPTPQPTTAAPTDPPTASPTPQPSQAPSTSPAPTGDVFSQLLQTVRSVSFAPTNVWDDSSSYEFAALQFVSQTAVTTTVDDNDNDDKLLQRYALTVLDYATSDSLSGTTYSNSLDECLWAGVDCNANGTVTTINWPAQDRGGTIPPDIGLLTDLTRLDLAENLHLHGSIPDGLYNLPALQELYLHENRLTGSLSDKVSQLSELVNLYLSENLLTGTFPKGLASPSTGAANVRPLRYITLYNNSLTGSFPEFLNLRNLYYLDVGYNQMNGTIPTDWYTGANSMQRMRHLYLNNNQFEGFLSEEFTTIAGGRLNTLLVANNKFSGEFPGGWNPTNFLQALELQNGGFTSMDKDICSMNVFVGGEMTSLRADCDICQCGRPFCVAPICS